MIPLVEFLLQQRRSLLHPDSWNNSLILGTILGTLSLSRCISHYWNSSRIPSVHQDTSRLSRSIGLQGYKGHRQSKRFSAHRTELLNRVRQVPCRSWIEEHPVGYGREETIKLIIKTQTRQPTQRKSQCHMKLLMRYS
jgi:hypothetical protein